MDSGVSPIAAAPRESAKSSFSAHSLNCCLLTLKAELACASQQNPKYEPEKNEKRETAKRTDGVLNHARSVLYVR